MTNTGKDSEARFKEIMEAGGKSVFIYRLTDTNEVKGAFKAGFVKSCPSDFVVTENGKTFYAEVKSCSGSKASFPFSHFTPAQWAALVKQVAAGGEYYVFIHKLDTDEWFKVPGSAFLKIRDEKRKSIKFTELTGCRWNRNLRT